MENVNWLKKHKRTLALEVHGMTVFLRKPLPFFKKRSPKVELESE